MAKNDYQALAEASNPFVDDTSQSQHEAVCIDETTTDTENEDGNRDHNIMIHVVPDTSKGITHTHTISLCVSNVIYFEHVFQNSTLLNYSSLESYRRFGLVFHTNVLLPSEAWI